MVTVDHLSSAHWVLIQYVRLCVPEERPRGWRPCRDHGQDLFGELFDLARVVQEVVWVDAQRGPRPLVRERAMSATAPIGLSVPR